MLCSAAGVAFVICNMDKVRLGLTKIRIMLFGRCALDSAGVVQMSA